MDPKEYDNLSKVETHHWFYSGKREIVRYWIHRIHPLAPTHLLADCGAGTGRFAAEMTPHCRVLAIDDHEESLELARGHLGAERVKRGTCGNLPLADGSVDVLTALDVIEHVEKDREALREFARVVRPGGIVVITVPALMMLWSDWDVALHHFRRYNRRSLLDLIPRDAFEVVHVNYVNVVAFPLVLLVRKWRALKARLGLKVDNRSEDDIPPGPLNALLRWSFVWPACQRLIPFPIGVGLIAVLRRKEHR
jgi:SAM-dependent methyltransferase